MKYISILLVLSNFLLASGIDKVDTYNKNSDLQWEWAMASIEKYPWIGNERILDVGCGDGKISKKIAEKIPSGMVVGVDVSLKMIQFASTHCQFPNLLFLQGDSTQLPFKEQFDVVVSFNTLHWVLDQKKALENIKESLICGGKTLLITPATSPNNLSTQCEQLVCTKKWAPFFPNFKPQRIYFDKTEYEKLLLEVGLIPINVEVTPCEIVYPNKQRLREWLKPLVTFTTHLSEELQVEFLNDLVEQMLVVDPMASDGMIHIRYRKLEVIAAKN